MLVRRMSGLVVVGLLACPVFGQWESGSDGSDGAFSPAITTVVDLSLAASLCDCDGGGQLNDPCRWDCPSPVAGRGVYDAQQWAVVYKYTTVNVPSGATITFNMHPSGAPVVWLATGNVTINGRVNLDGEDWQGFNTVPAIIPYYTKPGPGGFEGGQSFYSNAPALQSFGLGPGSSPTLHPSGAGGNAAYAANLLTCTGSAGGTGAIYGNAEIVPLIGGSGGNSGYPYSTQTANGASGGAGGGAILVASPTQISVGATGSITADGGDTGSSCDSGGIITGSGSGGAVRLRSDSVNLAAGSQVLARSGTWHACGCGLDRTGQGRVRIEASTITNFGTIGGIQSFPGAPSPVFAASPPPQLFVTSVCGNAAPAEPVWGIKTTDVDVNSASACTVSITGSGMPVGTIVVVRAIPARGNIISVNSTPMVDAGGGLRTATASVTFPGGRTELQLRANW